MKIFPSRSFIFSSWTRPAATQLSHADNYFSLIYLFLISPFINLLSELKTLTGGVKQRRPAHPLSPYH